MMITISVQQKVTPTTIDTRDDLIVDLKDDLNLGIDYCLVDKDHYCSFSIE